ncbi:MAG TPA: MMPL family transporter, partial [Thermopolyspora sp.]
LPIPLARSIAYGGITAVACAVVAGLLVPPALLVALGHRVRARPPSDREGVTWPAVFRRPLVVTPPIVALSLVLAAPFAHVRFGLPDDRVLPPGAPAAQVARDVRQTFPINATIAATTVVLPGTRPPDPRALDAYARRISLLPGALRVDAVTGTYVGGRRLSSAIAKVGRFAPAPVMPATKGMGWWIRPVSRSGGGVARPGRPPFSAAAGRTTPVPDIGAARFISPSGTWLRVITSGEADSPENGALAREIRAVPAPGRALVGGPGARLADVTGVVRDRLVPGLALVAAVMLALLCAVTRSPLLAVRTLLAHALGLAAALGIVVHIFQDGHLRALVGDFTPTGGIDALMPGVVCCAGSALAMSHQMFLLCRIREERRHVADTPKAVALGVRHTGWPLVATALLSAAIMLSLTASVTLKMAGIGVAVAVLVTAGLIFLQALPPVSRTRPRIAPARPRRPGPGRP